MKLVHLLSIISVIVFVIFIFFVKSPRKFYVLFVLYMLPIMDLPITPPYWGSLRVFDGISYFACFILVRDFISIKKQHVVYHIIFVLFTISLLFGSLNSEYVHNSLFSLLTIFPVFIFAKSIINQCAVDEEFQKQVIFSLKFIALFSIIFLIIQIIRGLDFTFYTSLNRNTIDRNGIRYPSFFHDPQKYQQYLAILSFIFLINYKNLVKPGVKNYILFFIVISAMIATGGRSAFIGLFAGMLLLFFFLNKRYKIGLMLLCFVGVLLLTTFSDSLLILKRSETFEEDYLYRASLWEEAYEIFKNQPMLGIGHENYHLYVMTHSDNYFINELNDVVFFVQPESGYWKILTELGLLGFTFIFSFILIPIFTNITAFFKGQKSLIIFFYVASILTWLVSFITVYSLYDKRVLILVISFVSLLISTRTLKENSETKTTSFVSFH